MRPSPPSFRPSDNDQATLSLTWGQVIFVALWVLSCAGARWTLGAWPTDWWPLAYVFPAAIAGITWDLTVARASVPRSAIRISLPKY